MTINYASHIPCETQSVEIVDSLAWTIAVAVAILAAIVSVVAVAKALVLGEAIINLVLIVEVIVIDAEIIGVGVIAIVLTFALSASYPIGLRSSGLDISLFTGVLAGAMLGVLN